MRLFSERRYLRTSRPRSRGQSLVELALVAPILILLIAAIFQFAYVFQTQIGVTNAVREAARRAAAANGPNCSWVMDQLKGAGADPGLLAQNVQAYNPARLAAATVTFTPYQVGGVNNYRITVGVTYSHPEFFPIAQIAALASGHAAGPGMNWDVGVSADMRLEHGDPSATWGACP